MTVLILLLIAIFITVFVFIFASAKIRNKNLDTWAKSIQLTDKQQEAMWSLWQSFKAGIVPEEDPLAKLSKQDKEYLKKICSSDFRPAKFGSANALRLSQFTSLYQKGYTPEQAAIIVGMTINRVGRKDLK